MNEWSIWEKIKTGFWVGTGFIVPSLIVYFIGTYFVIQMMPSFMEYSVGEDPMTEQKIDVSDFTSKFDKTGQVKIVDYRETMNGSQLLVLGSIKNTGATPASSISIEAELFDKDGKFVFECSDYISTKLQPSKSENFQIKCGCNKQGVPEYDSVSVRVVSASSY